MNSVNWHPRWSLVMCVGLMVFMIFGVSLSTGCSITFPGRIVNPPPLPDIDCPTGMARLANTSKKITDTCTLDADSINTDDDGDGIPDSMDVDADGDGLIEIKNAVMLDNMRHDLSGTSYKTKAQDLAGEDGNTDGCPAVVSGSGGCNGYELTADIDLLSLLDANGNGMIDTTMEGIDKNADGDTTDAGEQITVIDIGTGKDKSWVPIGTVGTGKSFTGTFEGNNHTIANLWMNSSNVYTGLFGVTGGTVAIRNVGVISGLIHVSSSNSGSGGLVGYSGSGSTLTITNSYFSGAGGVSSPYSASYSGGLVGYSGSGSTLTITNSYFSGAGGVFSASGSGGLVGYSGSTLTITNSYFSGGGGVSSSNSSGGLVGVSESTLTITNSYFSGGGGVSSVSSSSNSSGGLVGYSGSMSTLIITNSYFSGGGGVSSSSSSYSYSGGLVGFSESTLSITNSYFSGGGGVSSSSSSYSYSGGLVGFSGSTLSITNSYFSGGGGVSSSSSSSVATASSSSGGLVGFSGGTLSIANSYFSGEGGVSTTTSSSSSYSGGLVGYSGSTLSITNSYFSGGGGVSSSSSSSSHSGGLVGSSQSGSTLMIMNSYWNTDAPQKITNGMTDQSPKLAVGNSSTNRMGTTGLTLTQLQAITVSTTSAPSPSGLPHSATDNTKAWDLGTASQLPAVKLCVSPTVSSTNVVTCASYGALLAGQR